MGKPRTRWSADLADELHRLEQRGLRRRLQAPSGLVDFSSNDYLGLNATGELAAIFRETAREWNGTIGATGSRLISGHHEIFQTTEEEFARYLNQPASLLFHSGYAANVGAISAVAGPRDLIFCDRLCHASILDGIRLSGAERIFFKHNDLEDLRSALQKARDKHSSPNGKSGKSRARFWIITESVFSMDGDVPPLKAICDLADEWDALVFLDEAHAIGCLGPHGAGLAARENLSDRIAVLSVPCGKAPGLMGAFVAGPSELKDTLINHARSFVFSTAQPPVLADVLRRVIRKLSDPKTDRARAALIANADRLRNLLSSEGFSIGASSTYVVPVITGTEESALHLAGACRAAGFDVRAIRPPSVPPGTSRLRVSVHMQHNPEQLEAVGRLLTVHRPTTNSPFT